MLSNKEHREYITSVIRTILDDSPEKLKPRASFANEVASDLARGNQLLAETGNDNERSLLVSASEVLRAWAARTLIAGGYGSGGALVGDAVGIDHMSLMLRPYSVCLQAGATMLPILQSPLSIPIETSATTFSWAPEVATAIPNDSVFGSLNLSPHKIMGSVNFSTQLSAQAGPILEERFLETLRAGWAASYDKAGLAGTGVSGEPLGAFYQSGTGTVTFSGAATLAKAIDFQTQILNNDGRVEDISAVATPNVRAKWMAIARFANGSDPLWRDDETVVGRRAYATTAMPANSIMSGAFKTMMLAFFAPKGEPALKIIRNPYSSALAGQIQLVVSSLGDCGVTRPNLWVKSADSAAV